VSGDRDSQLVIMAMDSMENSIDQTQKDFVNIQKLYREQVEKT
jgi:hypothetical protein